MCGKDATALAAIELDDNSHEASARKEADARKGRATQVAGVRLIRWHVKALPDAAAIRAELAGTAQAPVSATPAKAATRPRAQAPQPPADSAPSTDAQP